VTLTLGRPETGEFRFFIFETRHALSLSN
jgi:hypothetical protein